MWSDWRLAYANEAWRDFALSNGGAEVLQRWPLGADVSTAISAEVRSLLQPAFDRQVAGQVPQGTTHSVCAACFGHAFGA